MKRYGADLARVYTGMSLSAAVRAAFNLPSNSSLAINNTVAPVSGEPENPDTREATGAVPLSDLWWWLRLL